mmetsp:Transcript_31770/g.83030  ORF Transcript_31770/g.83030 Transcript_31770/m.83030 type:complete len:192 (-) Transcript_31770:889-1464(-)
MPPAPAQQSRASAKALALPAQGPACATTTTNVPGLVSLRGGVIFVGSADGQKRPHGGGELLLVDGSVHVGLFEHGAAHGEGVYYDCKGSVHCGSWVTNHRVGPFEVLDPAGGSFDDVYDTWGKRTSRKRVTPATKAAEQCRHCCVRFHYHHNFKCRRHEAAWDDGASLWLCCGARAHGEPGCNVAGGHEAR